MPDCYLLVHFDRTDCTYRLGEKITGQIEIRADEDGACRKLVLTPVWRTRGRGDEDSAQAEGAVIPAPTYRGRQSTWYPFEIPPPPGPLSCRGELISVEWFLRAHADLRLALDAESEEGFILSAPAADIASSSFERPDYKPFYSDTLPEDKLGNPTWSVLSGFGCLPVGLSAFFPRLTPILGKHHLPDWSAKSTAALGVFCVLVGLAAVAIGTRAMLRERRGAARPRQPSGFEPGRKSPCPPGKYWENTAERSSLTAWATGLLSVFLTLAGLFLLAMRIPALRGQGAAQPQGLVTYLLIMAVLLTGVGLYGTVRWLRPALVRWRFGAVDVQLGSDAVNCGQEFSCTVQFRPRASVRLAQASAKLEAIEVVHYRSGKKKQTETHPLQAEEIILAEGRDLMVEESTLLAGSLRVPADAPPTFVACSNRLLWFVTVTMKSAGWPDWTRSIPVVVRP